MYGCLWTSIVEDPTFEVALSLGTVRFIIVCQEEMSNCYSRVKMVVNVPIARGDYVYIESLRQPDILEVLGHVSQCSGHRVGCIGVESSAGLPGHAS